jgi:hypothetical protein
MPKRDLYHDAVRASLIKDGWTITHDPLVLPLGDRKIYVDLGAENTLGAEREGRQIAVEIKGFGGPSEVDDLEKAIGQYALYRFVLARREPQRALYLAVSQDTYTTVFGDREIQDLTEAQGMKLVLFDPAEETIVKWIE